MAINHSKKQPVIYVNSVTDGLKEPDIKQKLVFAKLSKPKFLIFAAHQLKNIQSVRLTQPLIDENFLSANASTSREVTIPLSISSRDKMPHLLLDDESVSDDLILFFLNSVEFQATVQKYNQIFGQNFLIFSSDLPNIQLSVANPIKFDFAQQDELLMLEQNKVHFYKPELEKLFLGDAPVYLKMRSYLSFLLIARLLQLQIIPSPGLTLTDYYQFQINLDYTGIPADAGEFELMIEKILTREDLSDLVKNVSYSYFKLRRQTVSISRYRDADSGKMLTEHEVKSVALQNPEENYFIDANGRRRTTFEPWNFTSDGYELLLEDFDHEITTKILVHQSRLQEKSYQVSLTTTFEGLDENFYNNSFTKSQQHNITIKKSYQVDQITKEIITDSIEYSSNSEEIELLHNGDFRLKVPIPPEFKDYLLLDCIFDQQTLNVNDTAPLELKCQLIYQKKPSRILLKFLDLDDEQQKVLLTQTLEELPLTQRELSLEFSENYQLQGGPLKLVFPAKPDSQEEVSIGFRHKVEETTKEATFTVNFDGLPIPRPFVQKVPYLESRDLVTGIIKKNSDNPTVSFSAPEVTGYELLDKQLQTISFDFGANGFEDVDYTLRYQQIPIEIPVKVIDENDGKTLESFSVFGYQGEPVKTNWKIPENYECVSSDLQDDMYFDIDKNQTIQIIIRRV
ncbi:hypothetical protein [Lactovum odontotermitis]